MFSHTRSAALLTALSLSPVLPAMAQTPSAPVFTSRTDLSTLPNAFVPQTPAEAHSQYVMHTIGNNPDAFMLALMTPRDEAGREHAKAKFLANNRYPKAAEFFTAATVLYDRTVAVIAMGSASLTADQFKDYSNAAVALNDLTIKIEHEGQRINFHGVVNLASKADHAIYESIKLGTNGIDALNDLVNANTIHGLLQTAFGNTLDNIFKRLGSNPDEKKELFHPLYPDVVRETAAAVWEYRILNEVMTQGMTTPASQAARNQYNALQDAINGIHSDEDKLAQSLKGRHASLIAPLPYKVAVHQYGVG